MKAVRVFFSKTGRASYISHLDLMRAMTRALKRSRLPVWYTEGFNPHIYLTFALPLSLGYEGSRESMDFRLLEDMEMEEVLRRLRGQMPLGVEALSAREPVMKPEAIAWADYHLELQWDEMGLEKADMFEMYMGRDSVIVKKKTKKGVRDMELAPHRKLLRLNKTESGFQADIRLAAGINLNINPGLLLDRFYEECAPPAIARVRRDKMLTENLEPFE